MLFDARLNHIRTAAKLRPNARGKGRPLGLPEALGDASVPLTNELGQGAMVDVGSPHLA